MSNVCRVCGRQADPFRDHVQVVGMRVEIVCRACAGGPPATAPITAQVSTPVTGASAQPVAPAPPPAARTARSQKELLGLVIVLLVAGGSIAIALAIRARGKRSAPKTPVVEPGAPAADAGPGPRVTTVTGKKGFTIRTMAEDDATLDEPQAEGLQAVLQGKWIHPLVGPFRELPPNESTRFGAYRSREKYKYKYCGSGHCGNDLGNKVGLPVVAVRDGVFEVVTRSPTEVEGKWLKLRHPGGLHSYYMHLDQIAPGLKVGDEVMAGTQIGTLGTTGIKRSEAHLHFMISFDGGRVQKELFIDPEPIVREADLIEIDDIPAWAMPTDP